MRKDDKGKKDGGRKEKEKLEAQRNMSEKAKYPQDFSKDNICTT